MGIPTHTRLHSATLYFVAMLNCTHRGMHHLDRTSRALRETIARSNAAPSIPQAATPTPRSASLYNPSPPKSHEVPVASHRNRPARTRAAGSPLFAGRSPHPICSPTAWHSLTPIIPCLRRHPTQSRMRQSGISEEHYARNEDAFVITHQILGSPVVPPSPNSLARPTKQNRLVSQQGADIACRHCEVVGGNGGERKGRFQDNASLRPLRQVGGWVCCGMMERLGCPLERAGPSLAGAKAASGVFIDLIIPAWFFEVLLGILCFFVMAFYAIVSLHTPI